MAGAVGAQQTVLGRGLDRTQTLDALRAVGALEEPDSTQTPGVAGAVGARSRQRSGGARQDVDTGRAQSSQHSGGTRQHSDTRRGRSGQRSEQTALGRGLDRTQTLDALRAVGALAEPDSTQTPGVAGAVGARSRQRSGGARQDADTRRGRSGRRSADSARSGARQDADTGRAQSSRRSGGTRQHSDTRRGRSGQRSEQTALGRGLDRTQTLDALRAVGALAEPDSTQTPGVAGAVGARSRQRSGGARQDADTRRGRSGRRSEQTALGRGQTGRTPDALRAVGALAEPDSTQTPGVAGADAARSRQRSGGTRQYSDIRRARADGRGRVQTVGTQTPGRSGGMALRHRGSQAVQHSDGQCPGRRAHSGRPTAHGSCQLRTDSGRAVGNSGTAGVRPIVTTRPCDPAVLRCDHGRHLPVKVAASSMARFRDGSIT